MALKSKSLGSAGSAVQALLITGGTNATPIVATFAANSGLKTGDRVAIAGITGLTAMNGIWELEAVTATTFKLLGSVGNGTYGGTPPTPAWPSSRRTTTAWPASSRHRSSPRPCRA
jgi:hypothetical protein